jgi:hypothetical protein
MSMKDTVDTMESLLQQLKKDLAKTTKGNKAAAQRVRTATLKLEKVGKEFRKESMAVQKKGILKKNFKKQILKAFSKK